MATMPQFVPSEVVHDLDFPQREAAFFYGLFLRGHSPDKLRRDIEVPAVVLAKWHREAERDPQLRDIFARMVDTGVTSLPSSIPLWVQTLNLSAFSNSLACTFVQVKNCQATKASFRRSNRFRGTSLSK